MKQAEAEVVPSSSLVEVVVEVVVEVGFGVEVEVVVEVGVEVEVMLRLGGWDLGLAKVRVEVKALEILFRSGGWGWVGR